MTAPYSGELVMGPIAVDLARGTVKAFDGRWVVPLTDREFRLLAILVEARGAVVPRERLALELWGRPLEHDDHCLNQLVHSLRRKIPPDKDNRSLVRSARGVGYWMYSPYRLTRCLPRPGRAKRPYKWRGSSSASGGFASAPL